MRQRLSPSLVIAVIALVLAAAGSGYAAAKIGSAQIKDNSVQSRDIKNRTLVSKDIKKKSLNRQLLDKRCGSGQVAAFGGCVKAASSGPSSFQAAIDDCSTRGGRILTLSELRWVGAHAGQYAWADGDPVQYEFSSDADTTTGNATAMDRGGNMYPNASAQTFWHHCLTY